MGESVQLSWPFYCCPLRQVIDIFDEYEMQTVEMVGDFYTLKSHAQHPIISNTFTNQFKQVLRRFLDRLGDCHGLACCEDCVPI